jgi:hypothetical protein
MAGMKVPPLLALLCLAGGALHGEPLLSSWLTQYSTRYARIYTTDATKVAGTSVTTWSNAQLSQNTPAYGGVQEIAYSASWVYITSSGLGSHIMGPWYNDATRTTAFVNLPVNQKRIFRIPRTPAIPATKTNVAGDIGYFVDGVHGLDASDATSYSNTNGRDGDPPGTPNGVTGDAIWNRDAYINEAITFDTALAHQQNTGDYHYHANPLGPRYLLGDHVDFDPSSKALTESTGTPVKHSPIIGWAKDGFPIYGPIGYVSPLNPASGVKRMVTGYVLRNGSNGTVNLTTAGRQTLPAWAARVQNRSATLTSGQFGPNISTTFPLGRYLEDNDYLGDLGKTVGVDFDLDEYNGRTCVTPEYPGGTYAYFVAVTAGGLPAFPYNLGRRYYGTPSGGQVQSITETVTVLFSGGPNAVETVESAIPAGNDVTLTWNSLEGGTYKVEGTGDLVAGYSTVATGKTAASGSTKTSMTDTNGAVGTAQRFYRVTRTATATYDPVTGTTTAGSGILSVSPTNGNRGTTFTLTINLDPAVNPPPVNAPVNAASIGTIAATTRNHVSATQVTAVFTIPAGAATGAQTVSVTFPGPPENPTATVTYTLTNGFTINATPGTLTAATTLRSTAATPTPISRPPIRPTPTPPSRPAPRENASARRR